MSVLTEFKNYYRSESYLTSTDINFMIKKTENPVYVDDYDMFLYNGKCYKYVD